MIMYLILRCIATKGQLFQKIWPSLCHPLLHLFQLSIHMQHIQKYIDLIEEILQIQQDIKRLQIQKKLKLRRFQITNS